MNEFTEYIRGYDIEGNEKLWIVTSGKVNSLALVDFNNDGKNEVNMLLIKLIVIYVTQAKYSNHFS